MFDYDAEEWGVKMQVEECKDMLELAKVLQEEADRIKQLHAVGFEMKKPVRDGWAWFYRTSGHSSDICA